jgi:hypothetical protein
LNHGQAEKTASGGKQSGLFPDRGPDRDVGHRHRSPRSGPAVSPERVEQHPAGDIARATFLAQQELDYLRALTDAELSTFPSTSRGESADETIDINGDGFTDFRRITQVAAGSSGFAVKILVFPATAVGKTSTVLLAAPSSHKVRAVTSSVTIR